MPTSQHYITLSPTNPTMTSNAQFSSGVSPEMGRGWVGLVWRNQVLVHAGKRLYGHPPGFTTQYCLRLTVTLQPHNFRITCRHRQAESRRKDFHMLQMLQSCSNRSQPWPGLHPGIRQAGKTLAPTHTLPHAKKAKQHLESSLSSACHYGRCGSTNMRHSWQA